MSTETVVKKLMERALVEKVVAMSSNKFEDPKVEEFFALIEAMGRDLLGQEHGVWRWRVKSAINNAMKETE